jgi:hypothetical protein
MHTKVMKQIIEFNKAAFENAFGMMTTVQTQMEKMTSIYMEKASGMPEEARKALYEWMDIYKKGCEDFKASMDEGFRKLDAFLLQKK